MNSHETLKLIDMIKYFDNKPLKENIYHIVKHSLESSHLTYEKYVNLLLSNNSNNLYLFKTILEKNDIIIKNINLINIQINIFKKTKKIKKYFKKFIKKLKINNDACYDYDFNYHYKSLINILNYLDSLNNNNNFLRHTYYTALDNGTNYTNYCVVFGP